MYRKVQALDDVDPEVIAKTRERIAVAEAEALMAATEAEARGSRARSASCGRTC
jgi:hypothetical protein